MPSFQAPAVQSPIRIPASLAPWLRMPSGCTRSASCPVGRYSITVELQGFKTTKRTDIALNVAEDRKIDLELATGALSESVEVKAESTPVKTVGCDVSGIINGEQDRELPLNGRNFLAA